jgi:hypothetical protein
MTVRSRALSVAEPGPASGVVEVTGILCGRLRGNGMGEDRQNAAD